MEAGFRSSEPFILNRIRLDLRQLRTLNESRYVRWQPRRRALSEPHRSNTEKQCNDTRICEKKSKRDTCFLLSIHRQSDRPSILETALLGINLEPPERYRIPPVPRTAALKKEV